jgi:hypothetical protein
MNNKTIKVDTIQWNKQESILKCTSPFKNVQHFLGISHVLNIIITSNQFGLLAETRDIQRKLSTFLNVHVPNLFTLFVCIYIVHQL